MENIIFIKKQDIKDKLTITLKQELKNIFKENEKIAVKLHMGEKGNKYFLKPELVKVVVGVLRELGAKPFLFDSPVMYPGGRSTPEKYLRTAEEHGFSEESMGCPVVVSDDFIEHKTDNLNVQVCKLLAEADGMLVLSHVKGHMCCGFGGAIKNLGMGGVAIKTKKDIHSLANPVFVGDCMGCESCVKACPVGTIAMKDGKADFNYEGCWGCGVCIDMCPANVLKHKIASFDRLLAEGAYGVLEKSKKYYFVNVMKDITKWCDCCGNPGGIIAEDVGLLMGKDIVSIEKASIDLINKKAGKDVFFEANKKSPLEQIKEAEKLGMGSLDYELVEK
ncbi:MAG: DUF362 domain-containing protein [Nanoarchaeota archaeon]|nr:DUF362 domain-containing protein [Nanoarchaeota archaeon]